MADDGTGFAVCEEHRAVDLFLKRFHEHKSVDDTFTNGCCYWFAFILYVRFIKNGAQIVYDPVCNHFAVRVFDRVYDVTGDITDGNCKWVEWRDFSDETERSRIIRDCVNF